MSVRTTADECRDRALVDIKRAISELQEIVVNECWGYDEYNHVYLEALEEAYTRLIRVRNSLK